MARTPRKAKAVEQPAPEAVDPVQTDVVQDGIDDAAEQPVELLPEAPTEMPAEISDKIPSQTREATEHRVAIWLSETRYFISTLEHDVGGEAGEIIAWLKARL